MGEWSSTWSHFPWKKSSKHKFHYHWKSNKELRLPVKSREWKIPGNPILGKGEWRNWKYLLEKNLESLLEKKSQIFRSLVCQKLFDNVFLCLSTKLFGSTWLKEGLYITCQIVLNCDVQPLGNSRKKLTVTFVGFSLSLVTFFSQF